MEARSGRRVAVVTGGTDGIGRAVAVALAAGGDRVIVVGRNRARGEAVLNALASRGHAFVRADLSLMAQTARAADQISASTDRIDAVVCCAGRRSVHPRWTPEGLEHTLAVNYRSRFLVLQRLLPMLRRSPSGRVVLVANAGRYGDSLDFTDLRHRHGRAGLAVSGRTQFANDLFATELAGRVRGTRIEVTCVDPGLARTAVFRNANGLPRAAQLVAPLAQRLLARPPAEAADTPVFLAQHPGAVEVNGMFFGPGRRPRTVPPRALRIERREALWTASEELTRPYRSWCVSGPCGAALAAW